MKEFLVTLTLVTMLGLTASAMMHACSPTVSTEAKAAAYGVELAKCRDDAGAWQEYALCKESVQKRFGVLP